MPFRCICSIVEIVRFEIIESLSYVGLKYPKFNTPSETAVVVKTARMQQSSIKDMKIWLEINGYFGNLLDCWKNKSPFSTWDQNQIGIKLETGHFIHQKIANFMLKKGIYVYRLESVIFAMQICFKGNRPEHNAKGGPHGTEF